VSFFLIALLVLYLLLKLQKPCPFMYILLQSDLSVYKQSKRLSCLIPAC
jgi:hypothetical protein